MKKMTIKVKKPEIKQNQIHLENEEKPIVEALLKVSEDFHGGDEITRSVDDQRFAQQEPSKEPQVQSETEEQEGAQNEIQEQGEQEEQEQEKTKEQEGQEWQEEQQEQKQGEQNEEEKEKQEGENGKEGQEEQGEQEETEEKEHEGQQEQNEEEKEKQEGKQGQNQNGEEENEETEQEEQTEESEQNSEQAFKLKKATQRLHLELYRLIEYLQDEEKTLTPEPSQTQALNVKKLLFRQYERKPINSYYYYKERTESVMILDNSGSMTWLQTGLEALFAVALKRKDVQVFIAPNGILEEEYNAKTKKFQEIEHEEAMKKIVQSGLPVLYIGDFDGANTPVELSWTNQVYWICTETRYKRFTQHDWVNYHESDFKGFFGRAFNAEEIIQVLKEFSRHIQQQHFWLDLHEKDFDTEDEDEEEQNKTNEENEEQEGTQNENTEEDDEDDDDE